MGREYPRAPVVAVAAAIVEGGRILLVRRASEPGRGCWSLPGGVVQLGERLGEAVVREALEETGLLIEVVRPIDIIETIIRDERGRVRFHYVIIDYLARPISGELRASSDALEARWVSLDEAHKLDITNTLRRFLERHIDELRAFSELTRPS